MVEQESKHICNAILEYETMHIDISESMHVVICNIS